MNGLHCCFLAEELAVGISRSLEDSGIWIGLPARVRVGEFDFCPCQLEDRSDHLGSRVTKARRRASLAGLDEDHTVTLLDRSKVVGGLDEVFDLVAHAEYAVRASIECTYQSCLRLVIDDFLWCCRFLDREADIRIYSLELVAHSFFEALEQFDCLSFILGAYTDEGMCFTRDSVVEVTPSYFGELPVDVLLQRIEEAGE